MSRHMFLNAWRRGKPSESSSRGQSAHVQAWPEVSVNTVRSLPRGHGAGRAWEDFPEEKAAWRMEVWSPSVGRESGKDENKQGENAAGPPPPPGPGKAV